MSSGRSVSVLVIAVVAVLAAPVAGAQDGGLAARIASSDFSPAAALWAIISGMISLREVEIASQVRVGTKV